MGHWGYALVTWLSIPILAAGTQSGWRPLKSKPDFIIGPRVIYSSKKPPFALSCSLYKAVMTQHTFQQYVQYKHHIPDMKEFTLCAWHKLYNYSTDHPIFSYSLPRKPRAILSWIMNSPKKSYYMLAVNGHTMYRINFPIKLHKWYHMCQSWNGKTGEWQLWINGERVGRGYYNLMVGKPIKGGGLAITGQERLEFGGGLHWKGGSTGMQGEVTLLQVYKAALSKGKAYSDHKHHHAHGWGHNGEPEDDEDTGEAEPSEETPTENTSEHPFLENGQLKPRLPVHELLAKGTPKPMHNLELLSAFGSYNPSSILKIEDPSSFENTFDHNFRLYKRHNKDTAVAKDTGQRMERRHRLKRHLNATAIKMGRRRTDSGDFMHTSESRYRTDSVMRKYFQDKYEYKIGRDNKRALVITEHLPSSLDFAPESAYPTLYSELDGHNILLDDPSSFFKNTIPDSGDTKVEYEPAEWEVKKIGEVCSACDEDPFKKANVLSWQETPKKLFAGAEYVPAIPKCHIF